MGHVVEAFLSNALALAPGRPAPPARVIALRQGVVLIPMTEALLAHAQAAIDGAGAERTSPFPELVKLTAAALAWMRGVVGDEATFVYVETDYDGGRARQAAAAWRGAKLVYGPRRGNVGPINEALALLGVHGVGANDGFDAVGLGRLRTTEEWASAS